jgi:EthD domain
MPIKMLVMVKRKAGLSPEEFFDGYENSHSRLAVQLFGHLWLSYRRNYLTSARTFDGDMFGIDVIGFDAVSEFVLRDEAAAEEMGRIALAHKDMLQADEDRWFDVSHCWKVACRTIEEDLSACQG